MQCGGLPFTARSKQVNRPLKSSVRGLLLPFKMANQRWDFALLLKELRKPGKTHQTIFFTTSDIRQYRRVIPERQESKEAGLVVALLPAWRDFLGSSAGRPSGHLLPIEKPREGMEAQRSSNSSYIHSAVYGNVRF